MVKTFYLFRHGTTFGSKYRTGYGWKIYSANILPEARPPLVKMGTYLKKIPTDYNVSSAVKRCRQTCEIISEASGKEFVFDPRLNEFFLETFGHLQRRIASLLEELNTKNYQSVLMCTHGAVLEVLIAQITKSRFKVSRLFQLPDPGTLLVLKNGNFQQINFNNS